MFSKKFPIDSSWQGILWSRDVKNIDPEADKVYVIHQTLMHGSLEQIKQVINFYSLHEVIKVFVNHPRKIYTKPAFNFIKNFILKLKEKKLNDNLYVKSIF